MSKRLMPFVAILLVAFASGVAAQNGPRPVNLGSASSFAILTKTGITDVPTSVIKGNVGVSPISGAALHLTCGEVTGDVYSVDAAGPLPCVLTNPVLLTTAVGDMETAYTDAAGRSIPDSTELGSGQLAGLTLTPGLYKWGTDVSISADVTLAGGPDAVWILQIAGKLNQASATRVTLSGGALARNIFWQVGGAVTIGTSAHFEGIVLAKTMIAVNTGATVNGRLFAQSAVSLEMNTIDSTSDSLRFVPVVRCRLLDTRKSNGPFGGPAITAGTSRDFVIPDGTCNIPATAQAYSLNVTVVPPGPLGYLTIWRAGQPRPITSTLNSLDGRIKANAAIVPAGTDGAVSVFVSSTTHVVLDIDGYFVPATEANALAFYPLEPCRVSDTRHPDGALGGPFLPAGTSRTLPIPDGLCNVPPGAQAYSLNITAVPSGPLGYVTAWPTGLSRPVVSTLNALTGAITANAAIVPAGTNGSIDVFASSNTHLVVDINGYFAAAGPGGLSLYNLTPCRVMDSRKPAGSPLLAAAVKVDVDVTKSDCGAPLAAHAFVLNATVAPPQAGLGYLTLWAQGAAKPGVSTLNALDGALTSNMALVSTTNGSVSLFPSSPTHLVLDITGYFAQ